MMESNVLLARDGMSWAKELYASHLRVLIGIASIIDEENSAFLTGKRADYVAGIASVKRRQYNKILLVLLKSNAIKKVEHGRYMVNPCIFYNKSQKSKRELMNIYSNIS